MMYGQTGELNMPAMGKQMSENELREELGGPIVYPYKSITLPNVLRLKILSARKLIDIPNLKPRVEVTLRKSVLSTPSGRRGVGSDGHTLEYTFGTEMLIPVREDCRDGVLIVRVYNDNVGFGRSPALIGIWFMTVKYLILFPDYCKHSAIKLHGDGAISGTFLLTDAKLRGSAMRALGPHKLGCGLSGELDMALHLTHSELIDPLPPLKPAKALDQLSANDVEDKCKFGNMAELKQVLSGLPIRFDIEYFTIRKAVIEMSDLFSHVKSGDEAAKQDDSVIRIDHITFAPYKCVTLLGLIENTSNQLLTRVALDQRALYSAIGEVLAGLGENMGNEFKWMMRKLSLSPKPDPPPRPAT